MGYERRVRVGVLLWVAAAMMPSSVVGNGNPMALVPEITGPFRVQLRMMLNDYNEPFHAIFHWTDEDPILENSILLAYGASGIKLGIKDGASGLSQQCTSSSKPMSTGDTVYDVRFEADGTFLRIFVDGLLVVACASTVVPSNVERTHYLAESPDIPRLLGAVTGVMVVNRLDNPPAHPRDLYKFMNFPTQILKLPTRMVASAYVRFDDIQRTWQRWFDFSVDEFDYGITCVKPRDTTRMRCVVYYGDGNGNTVLETDETVPGVVENQWAFWEFEIAVNGTFIIRKDGQVVDTRTDTGGQPPGIFRPHSFFGGSIFQSAPNQNLQGVVLGFRLDVEDNS